MNKYFIITLLLSIIFVSACTNNYENEGRKKIKFNAEWKFSKGDINNAQAYDFDDSGWRDLDLPHDWAIEGPFTKEVHFGCGYLPFPGIGWYRKTFEVPGDAQRIAIEFDGVMKNAKIWLNDQYIGGWPYGYSSFSFDLSKYVKRDAKNVLGVRVENDDKSSRWYPGSGIYRNVWLKITNPVHIAHWGTYITTPEITESNASVKVRTFVQNQGQQTEDIVLETSIIDAEGNIIATKNISGNVAVNAKQVFEQQLEVNKPRRWDIKDPYLYTVVSLVKQNGKIVDNYETPFGIRTFRFDADQGFFLNGRHVKIKGVNLHHDLGPLGSVVSIRATERQLEIMKEMGCNAIRTAHNPPSPEQLDLCDALGLLVVDETFDEWNVPKMPNSYNKLFDEWAEKDTRALLMRDRNHPSIILWSIGNEIRKLDNEEGKMNAQRFADICHELDPTRPVIAGIHLSTKIDQDLIKTFDIIGLNYWQDRYEELHQKFPGIKMLSTESAAVLSSRGEYHFPVERIYRRYLHESLQISSYDLINTGFGALPDDEFKLQENLDYMCGEFVWSGFDYHGEPDPYENMWPAHSSYFGIVDMCGFPKDRFYLYQSQWSDKPMVHLLPHWNWEGREGEKTPVYCYTNCDAVELFVNGKSYGKKSKKTGEYRLKWDEITYQAGSIKAVAYDKEGNLLRETEIKTSGEPYKIELSVDRKTINADGEDLAFIKVQITDQGGNFCPLADNLISFKIEGEGKIACVGNGNPVSIESYQAEKRKTFHGLCLVIVQATKNEGEIRLTATSPGLEENSISFNAQKQN